MPLENPTQHIVVTGASGYIGASLVEVLLQQGFYVTALGRSRGNGSGHPHFRLIEWDLTARPPAEAFAVSARFGKPIAVIHLAHKWQSNSCEEIDENYQATQELLALSRSCGIAKFIFASSMSARHDALNRYGRVKARIEELLFGPGEIAVRIGMVYGGAERGLWGTLCDLVGRTPILPMVQPGTLVQPIHIDETITGLIRLATTHDGTKPMMAFGADEPVPFCVCLREIARYRYGKSLKIIPIPLWLALTAVKVAGVLPFFPARLEQRILGLAGLKTLPSQSDMNFLGLNLKPFTCALHDDMKRKPRPLIEEGRILFKYGFRAEPSCRFLKRYVRALTAIGDPRPLVLPAMVKRWPALMAFIEPFPGKKGGNELQRRLRFMLHIAETTPEAVRSLYDYRGRGLFRISFVVLQTALREAVSFPFRLLRRIFQ